jgi:hypothetical protein
LAKSLSPTIDEVVLFFQSKGYKVDAAKKFWSYYDSADWKDSNGKLVKNWKQKAIGVWFKSENAEIQTTIAGMNINDVNNFLKR